MIDETLDAALKDGALLLTVNRRLARALHYDFQQRRLAAADVVWQTPLIMPFEAWLRALYDELLASGQTDKVLLDAQQEIQIWLRVLEQSNVLLLNQTATASALASAWRTHQAYESSEPLDSGYLGVDQSTYVAWAKDFRVELDSNGWLDSASLISHLLANLQALGSSPLLPPFIQLAGFNSLTAQQQSLLDALESQGKKVAGELMRPALPGSASIVVHKCADNDQELVAMALWARQLWQDEQRIALGCVIPDLHQRRSQVMRVFDGVFFPMLSPAQIMDIARPYDISLGKPLGDWPVVASALNILQLSLVGLTGSSLTHLLLSPHLGSATRERSSRAEFDRLLRKQGLHSMTADALQKHKKVPSGLQHHLRAVQKISHAQGTVSDWCKRLSEMLAAAGWPGEGVLDSQERQAFEAWQDSLRSLAKLEDLLGKVGARTVLSLLRQQISQTLFQPETPQLPIQIVGMLESSGLTYDALWVAGLDANSWPPAVKPDPWLPVPWQKAVGVPSASQVTALDEADRTFEQWVQAAPVRVFSYAQMQDGQEFPAAHPLLEMMKQGAEVVQPESLLSTAALVGAAINTSSIDDINGPPVSDDQPVRGGARLFEDQANCPFSAFAIHRLLARPLEEPELGLDPRDQGNAFHFAIEYFWDDVKSHENLLQLSEEAQLLKITDCVERALKKLEQDMTPIVKLEQARLVAGLEYWMNNLERPRPAFTIAQLEAELKTVFEGLELSLKVDRIDQLDSGERVIIDYKTGALQSPAKWMQDRPGGAQLPLYAVLVEGIEGLCYAQVKRRVTRFVGKASSKGLIKGLDGPAKIQGEDASWQDNLDFWRERLSSLAHEIKTGHAAITPQADACVYCHLGSLCRIDPDSRPLSDSPGFDSSGGNRSGGNSSASDGRRQELAHGE